LKLKDILKLSSEILKANGIENPITDSQLIISHVLKIPRWKLITERDMEVDGESISKIKELILKRAKGVPLNYLLGYKEFFGIKFYINEDVLIPRPETEILVEEVLKRLDKNKELIGLDIGVGSGAITVSLLKNLENLKMYAIDISERALKVAETNSKLKNVDKRVNFIKSNLFQNIPKNLKFDFIVSNPPYIPLNEYKTLSKEVKNEPKIALIAGKEGLAFYERIISQAKNYLNQNGFLAFEVGHNQSKKVKSLLKKNNFKNIEIVKDLNNIERVVIGYI
jgi:release factor glutamine methyltransferase